VKKQFLIVTVPVANLRKEPVEGSLEYVCDDLQETQLLYNECLLYKDQREDWRYVEAVEQKKAASKGYWQGYPGWIQKTSAIFIDTWPVFNAVIKRAQAVILKDPSEKAESLLTASIGTKLTVEDKGNNDYCKTILVDGQQGWIKKDDVNSPSTIMDTGRLRKNIVETAKLFLGTPYFWGGRSAYVSQGTEIHSQVTSHKSQGSEHNTEREEGRGTRRHDTGGQAREAIGLQVTGYKLQGTRTERGPPLLHRRTGDGSRMREEETLASNLQHQTLNVEHGTVVNGVDCSSLTNLAYRVNWLDIPRDAHDQWKASTQIAHDALEPADLIFVSAEEDHDKITHVMMCLTGEEFIEALETGSVAFINSFKNKFGFTLHEAAKQGFIVNKRKIYFGSILIAGEKK
jgi:cell wall-associated NlpC family hydrolase